MICPRCGETPMAAGQRYCHACGGTLPQAPQAPPAETLYVVGDGSDRAMSALTRQVALNWLAANKGRLLVYGAGAAVALIAAVAVIMAIVTAIVTLVTVLVPFAIVLLFLMALARPRRRRRRVTRIYRF